ncbi:hypothetical protein [Acidovorax carolinensis]|nr:hypothetical protein [Acidovorax carolinensis]
MMPSNIPSVADPRRMGVLSGSVTAAEDIRKICNGMKRQSLLLAAAINSGVDPELLESACEAMSFEVLKCAGFDVTSDAQIRSVLPMVMEASAMVLADAANTGSQGSGQAEAIRRSAALGASMLGEIIRSRTVARLVEPDWPADIDSTTAIRISAATAMASVAVEITKFDFMHTQAECIKASSGFVVSAALEAVRRLAPKSASDAARLMLTQNLIQTGTRIYAACWSATAKGMADELDRLSDVACEARLQAMAETPLRDLLAPVNTSFSSVFDAVTNVAVETISATAITEPTTECVSTSKTSTWRDRAKRREGGA